MLQSYLYWHQHNIKYMVPFPSKIMVNSESLVGPFVSDSSWSWLGDKWAFGL